MLKQLFDMGYSRLIGILLLLLTLTGSVIGQSRKVIDMNGGWWSKMDSNQQYIDGRKGES